MTVEPESPALQRFLHRLSHELQNALSGVTMLLSALRRSADAGAPADREALEQAARACARMRQLVRDAVHFAEAGTRGRSGTVDCEAALSAALGELEREGVEVDTAGITRGSLPAVRGDAAELRLLFRHLVDNAVRYHGAAPPRVEITCERTGDHWTFRVSDRGVGIEPADRERVFEPLVRLPRHEDIAGSGLGLALCRRIVAAHGGRIGVEPRAGGGSTFWFSLPAA